MWCIDIQLDWLIDLICFLFFFYNFFLLIAQISNDNLVNQTDQVSEENGTVLNNSVVCDVGAGCHSGGSDLFPDDSTVDVSQLPPYHQKDVFVDVSYQLSNGLGTGAVKLCPTVKLNQNFEQTHQQHHQQAVQQKQLRAPSQPPPPASLTDHPKQPQWYMTKSNHHQFGRHQLQQTNNINSVRLMPSHNILNSTTVQVNCLQVSSPVNNSSSSAMSNQELFHHTNIGGDDQIGLFSELSRLTHSKDGLHLSWKETARFVRSLLLCCVILERVL